MREFNRLVIVVFLLTTSCASPPVQMTPGAEKVLVSRTDPADNFELIGPVTAQDGSGCGMYGRRGSYDDAVVAIRVKAAQMGANYVAIITGSSRNGVGKTGPAVRSGPVITGTKRL